MVDYKMLFYDLKAKAEQRRDSSEIMAKFGYDLYIKTKPDVQNKVCLDVGVGSGWVIHTLLHGGCSHCHGIDISNERIKQTDELLKAHGFSNYTLSLGDAENLDHCPSNHYDYVNYLDILEHLPSYEKGIQEVHRVLKNGGLVYIKTPNNYTDFDLRLHHYGQILFALFLPQHILPPGEDPLMLRGDIHRLSEVEVRELKSVIPADFHEHIHQFYPDELRDFLIKAGFEIVSLSGTPLFSDIIYNNESMLQNLASAYVALMETPAYQILTESLLKDLIASGKHLFDGLPADYVFSDNLIVIARKIDSSEKTVPSHGCKAI